VNPGSTDPSRGAEREPAAEAALLEGLRAGAPDAFETFVRSCAPQALAVARRLLCNEQDAQDAVQEAFISAFTALPRFQGRSRLSTWLHRIVVNAALMKLRSRRARPEDPIEELLPRFLEDGHHAQRPAEWPEPADALLERKEVREHVRSCIDRLPESYRTVLLLRDIEELDTSETARLLGIAENSVKVRLHRARQALRTLLEPRFRRGAG
jgi:RNA polymerase sigma-70 factor (ECF subfamily)